MHLYYDPRDDAAHEARGSEILYWLDDLDARPLTEARADGTGFLFAGDRGIDDYRTLVAPFPLLRDRPDEREPLLKLHTVLTALDATGVEVPTPRTWVIPPDSPIPDDITFPLFVRTAETSMKLGGRISKVRSRRELTDEMAELRRALKWDAVILAREWLELAPAGEGTYGPVPQEVRVWVVDGEPFAWSFHHLHIVPKPVGFPPSAAEIEQIDEIASSAATAFRSRLVAVDVAKTTRGDWVFIEAGPGSCAGTAHEQVFKAVASWLIGQWWEFAGDAVGGMW